MTTKERLDLIIRELGLSGRAFERECELANGSYASIRDGVGADKLHKILVRFPQISADWLLTERGEMWKETAEIDEVPTETRKECLKLNLSKMVNIISEHHENLTKVIDELQKNGRRSDRLLDMIELAQK